MAVSNREIYNNALVHLGQSSDTTNTSDYEARAPYLLAAFCSTVKSLDKQVRKAEGLISQSSFSPVCLLLNQSFPLCDRLVPAAALYIASMLVIDEDSSLSDSLYDKYCDNIASLAAEVETHSSSSSSNQSTPSQPEDNSRIAECESITDRYFFD